MIFPGFDTVGRRGITGAQPDAERDGPEPPFSVPGALDQLEIIGGGLSAADLRARSLWQDSSRNRGVSTQGPQGRRRAYGVPIPRRVYSALQNASRVTGAPLDLLIVYAYIESSFDPNARNGSYVGLFQMSEDAFRANGGTGSRTDPVQNALAAGRDIVKKMRARGFPRNESPEEQALYLYLQHQQGIAGAQAHYSNPDGVAWQNLRRFYRTDRIAQRAVTGNVSSSWLARFGRDMTSAQFIEHWRRRLTEVAGEVLRSPIG